MHREHFAGMLLKSCSKGNGQDDVCAVQNMRTLMYISCTKRENTA